MISVVHTVHTIRHFTGLNIGFCKMPRTRQEIAEYIGLSSVTYAMKKYVQPLIDSGQIHLTIPNAPSSPNQSIIQARF